MGCTIWEGVGRMSIEQWKENGFCPECRRKNYCSNPCKANKNRKNDIIRGAVANKLLNLGFPRDLVDTTVNHL